MTVDDDIEPDQRRTVAALEIRPDGAPRRRIDTHMSRVFVGRDRVYKLKRSRRHPFADFSSVEARRIACEAELAVNRKLAPQLYEAVLPVTRETDGGLRIGGAGEPIDWLVVMRRFSDGALLRELADAGRLTADIVRQAVRTIVAFHAGLPAHPETGHAADYRKIIDGLRTTEAQAAANLNPQPGSEALFAGLGHEFDRLAPLLEMRREAGWVRRGHGDLHLRNICIFDGRVTPFDALEFDPALATSDVLYDIAFLLMDLRMRGQDGLANIAMNQYWDSAGQPENALALLTPFMALRAAVRMAVAVEAGDLVEAARYRHLGQALLVRAAPRLVAIGGLSGTGKSTLGAAVAPQLSGACGARLLRTDAIRKAAAGLAADDHLPPKAYTPAARASVYGALADQARAALQAGASVVADATFRDDSARLAIERAAGDHAFLGLWLRAPTSVRVSRVTARQGDASDATAQIALAQTEPDELGLAWRTLDAGGTNEDLAQAVAKLLTSN